MVCNITFCSVLFFSRPQSEGRQHHAHTFSIFTLDLKHTSSSSLFHHRLLHRYSVDWSHELPAGPFFFCSSVLFWFLQRGRIACNAERYNTYINSVCLSVRPSVTRWYPIQTNEHRITRSSLWASKNTLVFWYQQWLGGDDPFHLKFALKVTHPPLKCADFDQYLLITSQP